MVRLTKIYTKVGDRGTTVLGDGATVPKTDPRVEAYGAVDEANAAIGVAVAALPPPDMDHTADEVRAELLAIQNELFDLGADLCVPVKAGEKTGERLRMTPEAASRLERIIDRYNGALPPLESFILPGGSGASAQLHVARTVVRRAERRVAALLEADPERTGAATLVYLNRLSDLLFVLARVLNHGGRDDVLWKPGATAH